MYALSQRLFLRRDSEHENTKNGTVECINVTRLVLKYFDRRLFSIEIVTVIIELMCPSRVWHLYHAAHYASGNASYQTFMSHDVTLCVSEYWHGPMREVNFKKASVW